MNNWLIPENSPSFGTTTMCASLNYAANPANPANICFAKQYYEPEGVIRTTCPMCRCQVRVNAAADKSVLRLAEDMKRLLEEATFSDVVLRSEGRDLHVHRNILSLRSPVFQRMFQQPMRESEHGRVDVADVTFDTLQRLATYMYSGQLTESELTFESAIALFVASDKYDVQELRDRCAEVILGKLSVESCGEVLVLADSHGRMKQGSGSFFAAHCKEICERPDWAGPLKARPELLCSLLEKLASERR